MTDNGQELVVKDVFEERDGEDSYGGFPFIAWLSVAGELLPAWWSQARDIELRKFWRQSDHLSGTVNTLRDMMVAMPVKVVARDNSIKSYVRQAVEYTRILHNNSESRSNFTTQGWPACYGAFIEDYHTIDNGAFLVVEGPGRGDEPLQGPPTQLIHLDGCECWRTQNPTYPIIYMDLDGKRYRLHKSRIIALAGQSTPTASMYGVGFCAVSRCVNVAQNLIDNGRYKQEKLGSRPHRGLITIQDSGGGEREAKTVSMALKATDEAMDNQGLTRYSKVPVVSVKGSINLLDLASLPDGFDQMSDTQLGMAVLALAFGVDMRQLAFAFGVAGQTKADAEVQHLKMRGKGPGVIIEQVTQQIESKFLPPYLKLVFDYQDDEQDKLNADIRKVRSERREKDLANGLTDIRTEREGMVEEGEITEAQFIAMELADGRTPDGQDVLSLFQSPDYQEVLPSLDATLEEIEQAIQTMQRVLMSNARGGIKAQASMALAALRKLKSMRASEQSAVTVRDNGQEEKQLREYGSTQFNLPVDIANQVIAIGKMIDPADLHDAGLEEEIHVTIKFGLNDDRPEPIRRIAKQFEPFDIEVGGISLFQNDEFDVIKLDVESQRLRDLNEAICNDVDVDSIRLGYNPHITIGYVKSGLGSRYVGLENPLQGQKIEVDSITLSRKNREKVVIPLGDQSEKALSRITYNGITVMASGQRSSTRPDKKYMRTVSYQGKERVVHYGDPDMTIKKSDPERRKSFLARHNCDEKKDPFSPGFWSCYEWD